MRSVTAMTFATEITVTGPTRSPAQMLAEQSYDGHPSVHDGDTAATLGLTGAPIEGPTHFSQFDPLAVALAASALTSGRWSWPVIKWSHR